MTISFTTTTNEVRTIDGHRDAVDAFINGMRNGFTETTEADKDALVEELWNAVDEVDDLDGTNRIWGIVYDFPSYELERLVEELEEAYNDLSWVGVE